MSNIGEDKMSNIGGNFTWKPDVTAEFLRQERLPTIENLPSFVDCNNRPMVMTTTATTNTAKINVTATGVSGRQYFLSSNGNWYPTINLDIHIDKDGATITSNDKCFMCDKGFNNKIEGFEKEMCIPRYESLNLHAICHDMAIEFACDTHIEFMEAVDKLREKIQQDPYFLGMIIETSKCFKHWHSKQNGLITNKNNNELKKPTNEQTLILTSDLHR